MGYGVYVSNGSLSPPQPATSSISTGNSKSSCMPPYNPLPIIIRHGICARAEAVVERAGVDAARMLIRLLLSRRQLRPYALVVLISHESLHSRRSLAQGY